MTPSIAALLWTLGLVADQGATSGPQILTAADPLREYLSDALAKIARTSVH
ncbi:hypothetical protein [Mycobacterium sp.]|uniref:hypothetical protein n=1 Tax=Mycobacterium sp. TaxID=1785 RepID=UPI003D0F4182